VTTASPSAQPIGKKRRSRREQAILLALGAAALLSVFVTIGIVVTLVEEGAGFFSEVSFWDFLTGTEWFPTEGKYGVLPLLSGTLMITAIAGCVAIPLGVGAAIYLSEYAPEGMRRTIKPVLEILAGMPTIVLGFFAIESLTPLLQNIGIIGKNQVFSALSAGIVVGVLILPLISSLSEEALRAVPNSMREGAYAVGATKRVVATRIVLPAALSGVVASIVLGLSRAIGETMAVTLAAGTVPNLITNPTDETQTMTAYIVQVVRGEAVRGTTVYESIFAVGMLLFVITFIINLLAVRLVRRYRTVYQ
jgi:phosphate transport system permease protein